MTTKKSVKSLRGIKPVQPAEVKVQTVSSPGDPPCLVCGGVVVEESRFEETATSVKMSPFGIHCKDCGIVYKFRPPVLPVRGRK
jgi:mevalonate kinase